MGAEVRKDVRWLLVVSLIMFFWSSWLTLTMTGYYFMVGPWYFLRNISVLLFMITVGLATLYTTNFWKAEALFQVTIWMFIVSLVLFFISNMQWIAVILGIPAY